MPIKLNLESIFTDDETGLNKELLNYGYLTIFHSNRPNCSLCKPNSSKHAMKFLYMKCTSQNCSIQKVCEAKCRIMHCPNTSIWSLSVMNEHAVSDLIKRPGMSNNIKEKSFLCFPLFLCVIFSDFCVLFLSK